MTTLMTTTEASRSFAAVVRRATMGETIIVTKGGERVAQIGPTPRANGAAFRALIESWEPGPRHPETEAAVDAVIESLDAPTDLAEVPWLAD